MFLLAELKDTIRIPPETFHLKLIDAVKDEINRKLANKVSNNIFSPINTANEFSVRNKIIDWIIIYNIYLKFRFC